MARPNSIFSRVPIELPNRSGFDCSHENVGTMTTGTLTPVLVDELLPNDSVSLGANFQVQLPPMATDFYGRVDYVLEAFFVPNRLLWGGWQSFMTHPTDNAVYPAGTPVQGRSKYLPLLSIAASNLGPSSLADYLGCKLPTGVTGESKGMFNLLPFLAYHRIYDDWYRDSRIQSPLFYRPDNNVSSGSLVTNVSYKPYVSGGESSPNVTVPGSASVFSDGVQVYNLRQRNFKKDYFTTASVFPQAGTQATLSFEIETDSQTSAFSIASLRAANSLQKWLERNNIAGYRYSDQIYAQYGVYPSDAIMDKCIYLGRKVQNVYTRSVFQTTPLNGDSTDVFGGAVGRKAGSSQAIGECSLVDNFRATEHGFLIVLASLVPHVLYGSGVRRYLRRKEVGDFAFPLLAGMGDQPIYMSELDSRFYFDSEDAQDEVFGWTDLYAEYKFHDDEVHGLLRDDSSLQSFALQRTFDNPELSSAFLQIPTNYLDQVLSADVNVSGFSCWYDIYFPYKKISTLPEYSLPTLADLKNTHKGHMSRGGTRL